MEIHSKNCRFNLISAFSNFLQTQVLLEGEYFRFVNLNASQKQQVFQKILSAVNSNIIQGIVND